MDYRFALARRATGATYMRVVLKSVGECLDGPVQAFGCSGIVLGDVCDGSFNVSPGAFAPDEIQHFFAHFLASMIARTSAMTCSCGMGGRGSASDSSTVRSSQST